MIEKVIFIFGVRWPHFLRNGHSPKFLFLPFSRKMLLSSKKLLDEKIFKTSFPIKKVIFIFVARPSLSFKREKGLGLYKYAFFLPFYWKIQFFFKLLNNKIFNTLICDEKSYVNFWGKTPTFPKKGSNVYPVFHTLFGKYCFFKIICWIKKYSASNLWY